MLNAIVALIGSSLQPIVVTTVLAQDRSDSGTPDRMSDPEISTSGPSVDTSLERAPDSDKAVEYQKAMGQGRPIPDDMAKVFHEHSIHVTEWLTKMGADMRTIPTPGEYPDFPGGAGNVC